MAAALKANLFHFAGWFNSTNSTLNWNSCGTIQTTTDFDADYWNLLLPLVHNNHLSQPKKLHNSQCSH